MQFPSKWWLIVPAVAGALLVCGSAEARSVLISGEAMSGSIQFQLGRLGYSSTLVAPSDFGTASFAGYDAIWLGAAIWSDPANETFGGLADRRQDLLDFVSNGGNLLAEVKGLYSGNATSDYPFGSELSDQFVGASHGQWVHIVDPADPVNAGLTDDGLSMWRGSFDEVYTSIGSFHGLTANAYAPSEWITVDKAVGKGHIIYTAQELSYAIIHGDNGAWTYGKLFLSNALSYPPVVPEPCSLALLAACSGPLLLVQRRRGAAPRERWHQPED